MVVSARLALTATEVEFFGKSAHAAASPWLGRSALDALELFEHGMSLMREHIQPTRAFHRVIKDGGKVANVISDYAKVQVWLRDMTCPARRAMIATEARLVTLRAGPWDRDAGRAVRIRPISPRRAGDVLSRSQTALGVVGMTFAHLAAVLMTRWMRAVGWMCSRSTTSRARNSSSASRRSGPARARRPRARSAKTPPRSRSGRVARSPHLVLVTRVQESTTSVS